MRLATIVNGVVTNVTLPAAGYQAQAGEVLFNPSLGVSPGWLYDGTTFTPPAAPEVKRHITELAFITRFSDAEAVAIDLASIGATAQAASVRRYLKKVDAATYIDLDREDTRAGVIALESAGLLAAGRALQILDAPVQDAERYKG